MFYYIRKEPQVKARPIFFYTK